MTQISTFAFMSPTIYNPGFTHTHTHTHTERERHTHTQNSAVQGPTALVPRGGDPDW